jgi:hypothetical protein
MKGTLTKNSEGVWMVKWSDLHSFAHGTHWMYTELSKDSNSIKYIKDNLIMYKPLEEGVEVEFEMVAGYDNNGPEHFPKYAKIITPEEAELKDWDVTLNDGLENEPYISDDFQIGPDGAYEHTEDMTPREKANDILDSFWLMDKVEPMLTEEQAKQCTLIAVDEIIKECYNWNGSDNVQWETKRFNYWNDVKQEIKNL